MDTIIYVIIGIFVLLYVIDKKELVKLNVKTSTIDETGETVKPVLTFEEKKRKKKNDIYKEVCKIIILIMLLIIYAYHQ